MKNIYAIIFTGSRFLRVFLLLSLILIGCGGGGGGGDDVDVDEPFSGDTGTGADNATIFWQYFGEIGNGNAVEQTADGGFIFAGEKGADYTFTAKDLYLAKSDDKGVLTWSHTFGGDAGQTARDVKQSPDGGFIAIGYTDSGSSRDVYAVRTDAGGNLLWSKSYDAQGGDDEGYAVCVLSNGYAIAGSAIYDAGSGQMMDAWFFKIDDNGDKLSGSDRFYPPPNPGWTKAYAMEKTRDSGFIMTGRGEPNAISAVKISEDGTVLWSNVYGTGVGYAVKQAVLPDNGFIIAGSTTPFDSEGSDVLVIKLDAGGNEQWRKVSGGSGMDIGRGIALAADGGYLIAGVTDSFSQGDQAFMRDDVYLIKLDASGNSVWQKVKGQSPNNSELANAIQSTSDGGYVITGGAQAQVMLAKFDKNGDTVKLGDLDFTFTVPETIGLISPANAVQVADTAVTSIITPTRTGIIGLDLFRNALKGNPSTGFCDAGGGYAWNPAPVNPVSPGSTYYLTFSSCSSSDLQSSYSGLFTLRLNNLTDDLAGNSYNVTVTLDSINVNATDDAGQTNIFGAVLFSRIAMAGNFSQNVKKAGTNLIITDAGITQSLSGFDIDSTQSESAGAYSIGNIGQYVIVDPSYLTGSLTITIQQPIAGSSADSAPDTGILLIKAQDNSQMTMTITTGGNIALDVDTNGDGTVDQMMTATWDDLN